MTWRLPVGLLSGRGGALPSDYWLDSAYDRRIVVSATNGQSIALHDHLIDVTVPAAAGVNSTLRVVEITSLDTVDKAYDWRYPTTVNHFWWLPASVSGTTVTIKTLGRWAASETRYFAIYWDSTSVAAATTYTYLDGIVQTWSYVVGGTIAANDVFKAVMGGQTYTVTAGGGDTTTTIAQAIRTQINAGAVATATGAAATLTITQTNKTDGTFTVASTGSTLTTGTITITRPNFFGVGRIGPDTTAFTATSQMLGLPYANPASGALTRPGFGRSTSLVAGRLGTYSVNGVGTQTPATATVTSLTNAGPYFSVVGGLTWSRSEWTVGYTATIENKIFSGRSSATYPDDGSLTKAKSVDVIRLTITWTCANAYTPTAVAAGATTVGSHELLSVASTNNTFGGNATENGAGAPQTSGAQSQNAVPNFYADASTGAITAYTSTDTTALTALSPTAYIFGTHGNTNGMAMKIDSVTLANFGSQSPEAKVTTQGNSFAVLQLRNLSNATTIPQGATITIVATIVAGYTTGATTAADNLLPDEVVTVMRGVLGAAPTISVGQVERYVAGYSETMRIAGVNAVAAIDWFQSNAVALTTVSGNGGYGYQVKTATVQTSDDDDGNYGEAYKLAGLCLRYLRTGDSSLVAKIETQVSYHIAIEAAAVAAYGSWWNGSAPYWYWPSATPSSGLTTEGGVSNGDTDPTMPGGIKGTINYTQGQVRRLTSVDQMHMVGIGLYHYLYLLRNSSAITANTTLRTNALSLLNRMATFEAAHIVNTNCVLTNLYRLCNGQTPLYANGINDTEINDASAAALDNPYWGPSGTGSWNKWQVSNTDGEVISPSSNGALDNFFRAVYATGSTVAGVTRYLRGECMDMMGADASHHEVTFGTASWNTAYGSAFPPYPRGWMLRAGATSNVYKWTSGRAGDDHFLQLSAGVRDTMSGRAAQRLAVLCLAYLVGGAVDIPVEQNTTTTLRSYALASEIDALGNALANYAPEPSTKAMRKSVPGWLGEPSAVYDPQIVDSAFTGYWMFALELWHLVKAGATYATYYPIGAW